MDTTRTARMLTRYNRWANELMFGAVASCHPAKRQSPARPSSRTSSTRSTTTTSSTRYSRGISKDGTTDIPPATPRSRRCSRSSGRRSANWTRGTSPGATRSRLPSWTKKSASLSSAVGRCVMTRGEIILHLVNHTTYHRGFAADLFYQVPAKPPTTDLTVFLRDVPRISTAPKANRSSHTERET